MTKNRIVDHLNLYGIAYGSFPKGKITMVTSHRRVTVARTKKGCGSVSESVESVSRGQGEGQG